LHCVNFDLRAFVNLQNNYQPITRNKDITKQSNLAQHSIRQIPTDSLRDSKPRFYYSGTYCANLNSVQRAIPKRKPLYLTILGGIRALGLQLPKWVELGAFILALNAGYVNAVGVLGFQHQSVSHLSGTATLLGTSILNSSSQNILHLSGVLLSFLVGSSIAGFLLHGPTLKLGRHYDTALLLESFILLISAILLISGSFYGHFFASAACGLQNALATTYSGAVIRTTHVTGIFTDLGIMLGNKFRGESLDARKAKLFLFIILGFILGGTAGALLYSHYEFKALFIPACLCLLMAAIYRGYAKHQNE
jgi:uncharacterized membrane protein YoaK (UPF0700 family)